MEALQPQSASHLNTNRYLVLMSQLLKSSCLVEYNRNCSSNGDLSSEAAVADAEYAPHPVIQIDDDDSEQERSYLNSSDLRTAAPPTWSLQGCKDAFVAHRQKSTGIAGDATESRSVESYERDRGFAVIASIAPRGAHQRPARIIQSPAWLPDGWTTEIRIREWGNTAGTKDKYYVDPANGRRFRSKKEVMEYIQTGNLGRWKRKAKPAELDSYSIGPSPAASNPVKRSSPHSASPFEQFPAFSQSWPIHPSARIPVPLSNNCVDVVSAPHEADDSGIISSAVSWHFSNQQNIVGKGPDSIAHLALLPINLNFDPYVSVSAQPAEIIDLDEIQDTLLPLETRSVSGNLQGVFLPFPGTEVAAKSKNFSSKQQSPYTPDRQNNLHSGDPFGGLEASSSLHTNKPLNVSRMSSLSSAGGNTPLLREYQMLLPRFAEKGSLAQTFGQAEPSGMIPDENDSITETKTAASTELPNSDQFPERNNKPRRLLPDQTRTSSSCPLRVKKPQKLKLHLEKEQLEVLGRELCRQCLDFVQNQLSTQL